MYNLKELKEQYEQLGKEIKKLEIVQWTKVEFPFLPKEMFILFADKGMNWRDANEWCKEQGGRLPTKFELQALAESGCISKEKQPHWYWSSSTVSYGTILAWNVDLDSGTTSYSSKVCSFHVMCVR